MFCCIKENNFNSQKNLGCRFRHWRLIGTRWSWTTLLSHSECFEGICAVPFKKYQKTHLLTITNCQAEITGYCNHLINATLFNKILRYILFSKKLNMFQINSFEIKYFFWVNLFWLKKQYLFLFFKALLIFLKLFH